MDRIGRKSFGESASAPRDWYAVQIQPGKQTLACLHLEHQNFVHFAPRIERSRRRAGRAITVREPLFPGYIFAALDLGRDPWRSVNGTIGVSRLVMFGDQPASLPAGFVERMIECSDADQVVSFKSALAPGDKVRIVGGAFDDVTGTLLNADRSTRVIVLINMLSGIRKVEVPRERLIEA
jgi:transcriptional antiterminator RfaH